MARADEEAQVLVLERLQAGARDQAVHAGVLQVRQRQEACPPPGRVRRTKGGEVMGYGKKKGGKKK
jgi:hypothetical protein